VFSCAEIVNFTVMDSSLSVSLLLVVTCRAPYVFLLGSSWMCLVVGGWRHSVKCVCFPFSHVRAHLKQKKNSFAPVVRVVVRS
jgi:hypothetical protein